MWKIVIALIMIFVGITLASSDKIISFDNFIVRTKCIDGYKYMFFYSNLREYGSSVVQMLDRYGKPQTCEGK